MDGRASDLDSRFAEQLDEAMYIVDEERFIRYWNPAAERLTGWSAGEVLGRHCADVLHHTDGTGIALCETSCPLLATLANGAPCDAEAFLRHRKGHRLSVELHTAALRAASGAVVGAVQLFHAGQRRRETELRLEELRKLSHLDALTGIANRRHFDLALAAKLRDLATLGERFGLLIADIDRFKEINDRLGHAVGDRVLRDVAHALAAGVRARDTVARIGGDEFAVICPWVDEAEIARLGERLRSDVESLAVGAPGAVVRPLLSLGGTLARSGEESEALFERADRALYRSKRGGRNRFDLSD